MWGALYALFKMHTHRDNEVVKVTGIVNDWVVQVIKGVGSDIVPIGRVSSSSFMYIIMCLIAIIPTLCVRLSSQSK